MTIEETGKLLTMIRGLYQNFNVDGEVIDAWYEMLGDEEYEDTVLALKKYARENKFAPTVSELVTPRVWGWDK